MLNFIWFSVSDRNDKNQHYTSSCPKSYVSNIKISIFCLFVDYVSGGELFTHLYQREHFTEDEVRIYVGEIILALEHLHKVSISTSFP